MNELIALDLDGGPDFVGALRRVWDDGDAALPLDRRLSDEARAALTARMGAAAVVASTGRFPLASPVPVETDDALVVATSGSSGEPKGVVLTHDAVEASAWATSRRIDLDVESDHLLACLPLAHVGGLSVVTRAMVTGTPLTVLPGFEAGAVMAAARAGASVVSLVPAVLDRIDTTAFRMIVLGGSAIPADRPSNSVATYGMTETGSGVVYAGIPVDGVEVRVVDGELQLRCPMLLRAYRDGRDPKTADGWYPTGDLGTFVDGRVTVEGRADAVIISGGENVHPEPVERRLEAHPAIAEAALLGRDDPEWGEQVVALVVTSEGHELPTLDELRDHVKATLPAWCAPRSVERVVSLPRTALGKLRRTELR